MIRIVTPEFIADGLCAQTDPDAYYPENGVSAAHAKRICMACDVRQECLDWALETDERFGIWGGLNEVERSRVRKGEPPRPCTMPGCTNTLPLGAARQRLYCGSICQSRAREERRAGRKAS